MRLLAFQCTQQLTKVSWTWQSKRFRTITTFSQPLPAPAVHKQPVQYVIISSLLLLTRCKSVRTSKGFPGTDTTRQHVSYIMNVWRQHSQWAMFRFPLGRKSNKHQIQWSTKVLVLIVSCDVRWHRSRVTTLAGSCTCSVETTTNNKKAVFWARDDPLPLSVCALFGFPGKQTSHPTI